MYIVCKAYIQICPYNTTAFRVHTVQSGHFFLLRRCFEIKTLYCKL